MKTEIENCVVLDGVEIVDVGGKRITGSIIGSHSKIVGGTAYRVQAYIIGEQSSVKV